MSEITPTLGLRQSLNAYRTVCIRLLKEPIISYQEDASKSAEINYQLAQQACMQLNAQLKKYQQNIDTLQLAADKYSAGVQEIIKAGSEPTASPAAREAVTKEVEKMQSKLYDEAGIYPLLDKLRDNVSVVAAQLENAKQNVEWYRESQQQDRGEHVETGAVLKHLKSCLPSNVMLAVNDEHRNANRAQPDVKMDVDRFVLALTEVAKARLDAMKPLNESSESSTGNSKKSSNAKSNKSSTSTKSTVAFSSSASTVKSKGASSSQQKGGRTATGGAPPIYSCLFCGNKDHYSTDCKKVATRMERLEFLRNKPELCLRCTRKNHQAKACTTQLSCYYCRSKNVHHSALCPERFGKGQIRNTGQQMCQLERVQHQQPEYHPAVQMVAAANQLQQPAVEGENSFFPTVRLQVAQSFLFNPDSQFMSEKMDIFFDTGCEYSFIKSSMASELELDCQGEVILSMNVFAVRKPIKVRAKLVDVIIPVKGKNRNEDVRLTLRSVNELATYIQPPPLSNEDLDFIYDRWGDNAQEMFAANFQPSESTAINHQNKLVKTQPSVVIGQDNYWKFNIHPTGIELPSGLLVVDSTLGLMFAGTAQTDSTSKVNEVSVASYASMTSATAIAKETLRQFHSLEVIGIGDDPYVIDDDLAEELILNSLTFDSTNQRYVVDWPYKQSIQELPSNKNEACSRFMALMRRFQRDKTLFQTYKKVLDDQLQKGVIEPCFGEPENGAQSHYLPHQPVLTPGKSTACRIVYDGSAGKPSLNECLYRGPINTPQSLGLLLRFRAGKIVLIADIEKAFLQIALHSPAKDFTRFFWLKDSTQLSTDNNIQIMRFTRVLFGLICSPAILGTVIRYHLEAEAQRLRDNGDNTSANQIIVALNNIYVDNFIMSLNDENHAVNIYNLVKTLFNACSMNMREWLSNSAMVMECIPKEDHSPKIGKKLSVMGLKYDPEDDTLALSTPKIEPLQINIPTRRNLNKLLASAYDPMGITAPAVLTLKFKLSTLLQQTKTSAWDEVIEDIRASDLLADLQYHLSQLSSVQLNRSLHQYGIDVMCSERLIEIHVFCDASKIGYATCAYVRQPVDMRYSTFKSVFLTARTKLSPLPSKTGVTMPITRLELLSVNLGAKLINYLNEELIQMGGWKVRQFFLWTDSTVAIGWLNTAKPLATFVNNRVIAINNVINNYGVKLAKVPTEINPADLASRGCMIDELMGSRLWLYGPEILNKKLSKEILDITAYQQVTTELSKSKEKVDKPIWAGAATINPSTQITTPSEPLELEIERFSSLTKLLNTVMRIFRLQKFLITRKNKEKTVLSSEIQPFNSDEKLKAWYHLLRIAQSQANGALIQLVKSTHHPEYAWNPEHQLVVRRIRIASAHGNRGRTLPYLPKGSWLTQLVITHYHKVAQHAGLLHTVADIRETCWIPNARRVVSKVLRNCVVCRKAEGGPFSMPDFHLLPSTRVQKNVKAFQHCGIDYMGPLNYTFNGVTNKHFILLFTCFSTRAIHLESTNSVSTADTLLAFNRFISRRGMPNSVYSDNAPAFKNCVKSLSTIKWTFITACSPWKGGVYERMVGLVKRVLKKACGRRLLTWNEFQTVMLDIEFSVNTRPLTCVSASDAGAAILRPIHFLWGTPPVECQLNENCSTDINVNCLDKLELKTISEKERDDMMQLWQNIQKSRQILWNEWSRQYLDLLKESQLKNKPKRGEVTEEPAIGQIVLVKVDKQPRGAWHLGKIIKLNYSTDKKIRTVTVTTNQSTYERSPIQLYPLEISPHSEYQESEDNSTSEDSQLQLKEEEPVESQPKEKKPEVARDDWTTVQPRTKRRPQAFKTSGKRSQGFKQNSRVRKKHHFTQMSTQNSASCREFNSVNTSTDESTHFKEDEQKGEVDPFNMEEHPPNSIKITIPGRESWKTRFNRIFGTPSFDSNTKTSNLKITTFNSVTALNQELVLKSNESNQPTSQVQDSKSKQSRRKHKPKRLVNRSPFHRNQLKSLNAACSSSSSVPVVYADASTDMQRFNDAGTSPISEAEFEQMNKMECDDHEDPEDLLPQE